MEEKDRGGETQTRQGGFKVVCWACCLVGPPALAPFATVRWYRVLAVARKIWGTSGRSESHVQRPGSRLLVGQGCFAVG